MTNSPIEPRAIRFERVSVRFGALEALREVSFDVQRGSISALCGPNGAGKSSAIRVVCGLLHPSSGSGQVLGEALATRPSRRRARIGYMAQHTVLYDELTVLENLRFRAAVMGLARHREAARARSIAHGLEDVAAARVGSLSGGWRQRVALCVAQLAEPELLVLDEPTAGLDAKARAWLWTELRALSATGVTVLLSTHDPAEAAACDALIVLEQGRVAFAGPPSAHWSARELDALHMAAAVGLRSA